MHGLKGDEFNIWHSGLYVIGLRKVFSSHLNNTACSYYQELDPDGLLNCLQFRLLSFANSCQLQFHCYCIITVKTSKH